ncbi:MAG: quinone oxidoreductase [Chloroflexi bacterium]|nr:quinone oxidoreductase [Chloroflexota bacterium]MDA1227062.1 quinone oxidoreductase [Chloroflexota bacterium]
MKAIQITETGGPEVMKYVDLPDPTPGPGQAVVEPKALGVNFTDVYTRAGMNPPASLPAVIGLEGAGVVTALGDGATGVAIGDRVAWSSIPQSYAEKVAAPADKLVKLPDNVSFEDGAAVMLQGMTAHYLCHSSYPVKPGDTALVHAAAGGVGLILTQMIKALGGTVIGTVSTDEKAELAKNAGADYVIKYTEQDFEEEVGKITGGAGIEVAFDSVGLTTFDKSVACLKHRGYMVLFGASSGQVPPVPIPVLNAKSLFLTRPGLGSYLLNREELEQRAGDVLDWVASGKLKLHMHGSFPLSEVAEAHRQLAGRLTTGKLLLIP